jgi:MHS family shikimate/dehydroshikimate transporter-like MFS transporter
MTIGQQGLAGRVVPAVSTTSTISRAVTAATIGTVIEWYDYALYGAASGPIINKLFPPWSAPTPAGTRPRCRSGS